MKIYSITVTKEAEVPMISTKHKEAVDLEKGYYHGVYVILHFNKKDGINRKEDKTYM